METATAYRGAVARLREWLPRGQTLPDEVWLRRHHSLIWVMALQGVGLAIFGMGSVASALGSAWPCTTPTRT